MGQQREFERKSNKKWVKYLVWEWGICTFDTTYEREKNIRSQHGLSGQFRFPSRWRSASSRAQPTKYDRTWSYINRLFLYTNIYFSTIHIKTLIPQIHSEWDRKYRHRLGRTWQIVEHLVENIKNLFTIRKRLISGRHVHLNIIKITKFVKPVPGHLFDCRRLLYFSMVKCRLIVTLLWVHFYHYHINNSFRDLPNISNLSCLLESPTESKNFIIFHLLQWQTHQYWE